MKKSNKVLLIAFLSFLLIITAVHLSLSAKYKNGEFTAYSPEKLGIQKTAYNGVQQVVLKDLDNVNLGISTTASVGKETDDKQDYTVEQKGAILYVTGKDFVGHQTRSKTPVWVSIPSGATVSATNVMMDTENNETVPNASMMVTLNNARLHINQYQTRLAYDSVSVTAIEGSVVYINRADIRSLNLRLQKSSVNESQNVFGSLQVAVDTSSEVSLSATHLIKAKITPITND